MAQATNNLYICNRLISWTSGRKTSLLSKYRYLISVQRDDAMVMILEMGSGTVAAASQRGEEKRECVEVVSGESGEYRCC